MHQRRRCCSWRQPEKSKRKKTDASVAAWTSFWAVQLSSKIELRRGECRVHYFLVNVDSTPNSRLPSPPLDSAPGVFNCEYISPVGSCLSVVYFLRWRKSSIFSSGEVSCEPYSQHASPTEQSLLFHFSILFSHFRAHTRCDSSGWPLSSLFRVSIRLPLHTTFRWAFCFRVLVAQRTKISSSIRWLLDIALSLGPLLSCDGSSAGSLRLGEGRSVSGTVVVRGLRKHWLLWSPSSLPPRVVFHALTLSSFRWNCMLDARFLQRRC